MPDLSASGTDRLRGLDALTSDVRSLLRRAGKVQRQTADLGDPEAVAQGRELMDATERLLELLEERRRDERQIARQRLLGSAGNVDQP